MMILGWYTLMIMVMSLTLTVNGALEKENMATVVLSIAVYTPVIIFVGKSLWAL